MDVHARGCCPISGSDARGVVVNVSSGAGIFTLPMISLYCASKFALEGFLRGRCRTNWHRRELA